MPITLNEIPTVSEILEAVGAKEHIAECLKSNTVPKYCLLIKPSTEFYSNDLDFTYPLNLLVGNKIRKDIMDLLQTVRFVACV